MTAQSATEMSGSSASRVLGRKMDSIPFSPYQVLIIFILALVGFIEGYDLFMTGSLIVLAKAPLADQWMDWHKTTLYPAYIDLVWDRTAASEPTADSRPQEVAPASLKNTA